MSIKQAFILAVKSMMSSKMRSLLTMLGIIIGVASVILLVSLVGGLKNDVMSNFESMGSNLISISISGRGGNRAVSVDDMMEIYDKNQDSIAYISPVVQARTTVKNETDSIQTSCTGTNEMFADIRDLTIEHGRFLEYVEVEQRQRVCVVGTYIGTELFGTQNIVGKYVKIKGEPYRIVGVLEETSNSTQGSPDDIIYIPYTLATSISRSKTINAYTAGAVSKETVDKAMAALDKKLNDVFQSTDYYKLMSQDELMEMVDDMMGTMTSILVGIAGISLLVGGIGIMNIMLVSVTERTREIGIRKSLGATPWDIMSQFVVEAGTTSAFGGILGILLGWSSANLAGKLIKIDATPTVGAVAVAFGVSVSIGIIFGYFPAKKASKLSPIEALRYE